MFNPSNFIRDPLLRSPFTPPSWIIPIRTRGGYNWQHLNPPFALELPF